MTSHLRYALVATIMGSIAMAAVAGQSTVPVFIEPVPDIDFDDALEKIVAPTRQVMIQAPKRDRKCPSHISVKVVGSLSDADLKELTAQVGKRGPWLITGVKGDDKVAEVWTVSGCISGIGGERLTFYQDGKSWKLARVGGWIS
jgi:hypothetical protein